MDLLDDIRAEQRANGSKCRAGAFIGTLDDTQRAAIKAALEEGIQHVAIGRWLKKLGFQHGEATVARHLRGDCQCQSL